MTTRHETAETSRWDLLAEQIAQQWIAQQVAAGRRLSAAERADIRAQAAFAVHACCAVLINAASFGHPIRDLVDALADRVPGGFAAVLPTAAE